MKKRKPREYLIDLLDCGIAKDIDDPNVKGSIHVIEKSAADKLAEVIEFAINPDNFQTNVMPMLKQALKEYRGQDEE